MEFLIHSFIDVMTSHCCITAHPAVSEILSELRRTCGFGSSLDMQSCQKSPFGGLHSFLTVSEASCNMCVAFFQIQMRTNR